MSENKTHVSMLPIIIVLALAALLAFFASSMLPIRGQNFAEGFDGNIQKSRFVEEQTTAEPVFTQSEVTYLTNAVQAIASELKMNILIFAARQKRGDADTEYFANIMYDQEFGPDTDGIFYYIDLAAAYDAYDYLSTSGKAIIFYKNEWQGILNGLDAYLPSSSAVRANGLEPYRENIKTAVVEFLSQIRTVAEPYANGEKTFFTFSSFRGNTGRYVFFNKGTLYVTESRPPLHRFILFLVAELISAIIAALYAQSVKKKFIVVKQKDAASYISNAETAITESSDDYLNTNTTRTYIPRSSGSGARGGFSGGGGTHGGGGHHR